MAGDQQIASVLEIVSNMFNYEFLSQVDWKTVENHEVDCIWNTKGYEFLLLKSGPYFSSILEYHRVSNCL